VVQGLKAEQMIQEPGPLPGREEEIEAIREKYNLPGSGMV
jgi:hypothetical protein